MRSRHGVSTGLLCIWTLYVAHVAAQGLPTLPGTTDSTASASTSQGSSASLTPQSTSASSTFASKSSATSSSQNTQTGSSSASSITASSVSASAAASSTSGGLTGLPKLPGDDYPAPTVPPTANAPFMQKSNLPEGTVFICVGAALAFLGAIVLAWRGLVAWSLHRSVLRAATAQSAGYGHGDMKKHAHKSPSTPFYSQGPGSTLSLDQLGGGGKYGAKSQAPSGSLFFSPTAGAGMHQPGNRGSGYLPAGYYAAGNSAAGGGAGMTHLGGGGPLSHLGSQSHGYSRTRSVGPTPPLSPSLPPSRGGDSGYMRANGSSSTLNLNVPSQGRAPSAYLEDLLEDYPPGQGFSEDGRSGRR